MALKRFTLDFSKMCRGNWSRNDRLCAVSQFLVQEFGVDINDDYAAITLSEFYNTLPIKYKTILADIININDKHISKQEKVKQMRPLFKELGYSIRVKGL